MTKRRKNNYNYNKDEKENIKRIQKEDRNKRGYIFKKKKEKNNNREKRNRQLKIIRETKLHKQS